MKQVVFIACLVMAAPLFGADNSSDFAENSVPYTQLPGSNNKEQLQHAIAVHDTPKTSGAKSLCEAICCYTYKGVRPVVVATAVTVIVGLEITAAYFLSHRP